MRLDKAGRYLLILFLSLPLSGSGTKITKKIIVEERPNEVKYTAGTFKFTFEGKASRAAHGTVEYWTEGEHHGTEGQVNVQLRKLKTGSEKRDKDMYKSLGIIGFPEARLTYKGQDGTFIGYLTIQDQRRKIIGTYELYPYYKLKYKLSLKEFKIQTPKFAGILGMGDEVEVEAYVR